MVAMNRTFRDFELAQGEMFHTCGRHGSHTSLA